MVAIRNAVAGDAAAILGLLEQLGWSAYIRERVTIAYIRQYLAFPHNNILLAEHPSEPHFKSEDQIERLEPLIAGLLAYSTRPDLYHGGLAAMIENFVVDGKYRGQGIGSALLDHLIGLMLRSGCVTLFVDVESDNEEAIRFYRRHGLNNQVTLLERHL